MIQLIDSFEVPAGRDDEFLSLWRQVNTFMVTNPGYVSHRLPRSLAPDTRYRFVNVAQWETPQALANSHDDGFRTLVADPAWAAFPSSPAVYETVDASD